MFTLLLNKCISLKNGWGYVIAYEKWILGGPFARFLREAAGDYWSSPGKVSDRLTSQENLWVQISNSCFLTMPCELAVHSGTVFSRCDHLK